MYRKTSLILAAIGVCLAQPQMTQRPPGPPLGGPLPGLTSQQTALFEAGKEDFEELEEKADGLGPAFNGISCHSCHNIPTTGGVGNISVLRAGRQENGAFAEPQGGSLIHVFATEPRCQPRIPGNANILARRIPTPLFGLGLVEAIPDETLRRLESVTGGRAALVMEPGSRIQRIGRFGWKAQLATLLAFAGDAYVNEMGITNDIFPSEVGTGLSPQQLAECDPIPGNEDPIDPATGRRGIDNFSNFMRLLAPPAINPPAPNQQRGAELFAATGCSSCHIPTLMTGPSPIAALDRKPVHGFSDYLLHDIGTGDGIEQGAARGNEFRTAPLWGMSSRKMLMHDGRALTPAEAIDAHVGQASQARDHFRRMGQAERQALLDYLSTL